MQSLIKILSKGNTLALAIFCTILILVLSLANEVPQPEGVKINDKIGHTFAYLSMSFFWLMYAKLVNYKLLIVALSCVFYGIVIEVLQETLTTTRTGSVLDVMANIVGVSISYSIVFAIKIKS